MDNRCRRHIKYLPALLLRLETEIDILAVHEIRIVQQAHVFEAVPTDHHKSSDDGIDLVYLIFVEIGEVVLAEARVLWEPLVET